MTATKRPRAKAPPIWCEHCNAEINEAGVRSCLCKTCESKSKITPEIRRFFK